ncbi:MULTISPECIES: LytR/AlgR family response regulator transcription factor [Sphingobacterium]|uniref:DNA-binding response regulator n=1 Tax=Sphingobacterium cellulitidis TaxID=1768011 RepID=A0A8H9KU14_9SPHI|nr:MULTISPECIES: LytTR family DNA-binding domain-containing protein [Sphingobacterium]MBA8985696.1 two-component system LytT family response regulator [Sphingobacterium soli]WFB64109.1 LytTR family DNA-binding domain-containing protein [Sphingobacterium sp. WM]GGE07619.1 DNA-binding response regulator [Sphingobacterium soli]
MIKAVILDDEIRGSGLLQHKLQEFQELLQVEAVFNDPQEALIELPKIECDILFLDVEMPFMNGFEFLEKLGQFEFEVIFVTAYNIYTLDALKANALDYLLKPVNNEELRKAMVKLELRISQKVKLKKADSNENHLHTSRIALPTAEGIHLVRKDDILRIEAMSNYSIFYLNNLSKIIVSRTLKEFEMLLENTQLFRVNRSVIVNLDYVVKYRKGEGGTVELEDGSEIEVSPNKKKQLMDRLFTSF